MELLKSILSGMVQYAGSTAIASYLGMLATYYSYGWLGWTWLIAVNHFFMNVLIVALVVGATFMTINLVVRLGTIIKNLFNKSE